MKIKEFKFDRGWKVLIYFDIVLPVILFVLAYLTGLPQLSKLFHSYETFLISPIPNISALTGLVGLIYHAGVIVYTLIKKNYRDTLLCVLVTFLVAAFFWFELNYAIIKPLTFSL